MTEEEMIGKFGERVAERIQVKNHDFRDRGCLVDVGYTIGEKPIFVNKEVYEAELKLAVGSIVPHHACGWAGGAKMVLPGISGEETIGSMHLLSARSRTSYLGILENPIRQIMEEAAREISFNTVFNTVLNRRGQIVKAFCGDIAYAFREGVNTAERCYRVKVPALADIVLASSYPYDKDFWQAHKTLYPAEMAVKANGTIVLVTPCYEGVSKTHKELYNIGRLKPKDIELQLQTGQVKDKAAAALCLVWSQIRKKAKIILVSEGISPREVKMIGFEHCKSVAEALEMGFQRHGRKATVTILKRADIVPQVVENRDRMNGIS